MPKCDNCKREVKSVRDCYVTKTHEFKEVCELCERYLLEGGYIYY